jgi:hypothetical protein
MVQVGKWEAWLIVLRRAALALLAVALLVAALAQPA